MWTFLVVPFLCTFLIVVSADVTSNCESPKVSHDLSTMNVDCIDAVREQTKLEMEAAITYLAMGAHFGRDIVNRPGMSKFFLDSATEERTHSIKLIDYLLLRGGSFDGLSGNEILARGRSWKNGLEALKDAFDLEKEVTDSILGVAQICEGSTKQEKHSNTINGGGKPRDFNDLHLVDYLTVEYLEEQYHSLRDLAGKLSTLEKMIKDNGALGEYLFDNSLLKGTPVP